jgi:TolB protein
VKLLCALFCLCFGFFQGFAEEMVVLVASESELAPLCIAPFDSAKSAYPAEYVQQLQRVLEYDLAHDGGHQLVACNELRKNLLQKVQVDYLAWRKQNVVHLLTGGVDGKRLLLQAVDILDGRVTPVQSGTLSGHLSEDRRIIHRLADALQKVYFGREGIAAAKFLYTVTVKQPEKTPLETGDVYEADWDGFNARRVTKENALCVHPCYVPAQAGYAPSHLLYVSYRLGQPRICFASLHDGESERLLPLRGNQLMPAVSAQRDTVAFVCDVAGNPDLFIQPFDPSRGAIGKPRQIFTAHRGTQASPTFSPDGKQVAFVSNKDGYPRIYVLKIPAAGADVRTLKPTLISKRSRESTSPCWSPDGSKLAYSSMVDGVRQIWVYDFATHQERAITKGPHHKENPAWAPNSLHLLYNTADDRACEIYLVHIFDPQPVKITSGQGEKRFPAWEPRLR